jgi:hypothetical protein
MAVSFIIVAICSAIAFTLFTFNIDTGNGNFRVLSGEDMDNYDGFTSAYDELQAPPLDPNFVQAERTQTLGSLVIVYAAHPEGDNVFTDERMAYIEDLEKSLLEVTDYEKYAVLDGNGDIVPQATFLQTYVPNFPDWQTAVDFLAEDNSPTGTAVKFGYLDKNFGVNGSKTSRAIRTILNFGGPLPGYNNTDDRNFGQRPKLGDFLVQRMRPILQKAFDEKSHGVNVVFIGDGLADYEVNNILFGDASLAIASMAVVLLYIWFHTRSLYYATLGMLEILIAFPMTYFLHRVVFQYYWMGLLNFLSLFILLGIGADDIFIFVDAWKQSHAAGGHVNDSLETKLAWTWKRSAKTMLVTTTTTAAAFYANAFSTIPPIQEFGVFTGTLVIVNYLLVITWFPACLILRHKYLRKFYICCVRPCFSCYKKY